MQQADEQQGGNIMHQSTHYDVTLNRRLSVAEREAFPASLGTPYTVELLSATTPSFDVLKGLVAHFIETYAGAGEHNAEHIVSIHPRPGNANLVGPELAEFEDAAALDAFLTEQEALS